MRSLSCCLHCVATIIVAIGSARLSGAPLASRRYTIQQVSRHEAQRRTNEKLRTGDQTFWSVLKRKLGVVEVLFPTADVKSEDQEDDRSFVTKSEVFLRPLIHSIPSERLRMLCKQSNPPYGGRKLLVGHDAALLREVARDESFDCLVALTVGDFLKNFKLGMPLSIQQPLLAN